MEDEFLEALVEKLEKKKLEEWYKVSGTNSYVYETEIEAKSVKYKIKLSKHKPRVLGYNTSYSLQLSSREEGPLREFKNEKPIIDLYDYLTEAFLKKEEVERKKWQRQEEERKKAMEEKKQKEEEIRKKEMEEAAKLKEKKKQDLISNLKDELGI